MAITRVSGQVTSGLGTLSSGQSLALTLTNNPTAGNLCVCCLVVNNNSTTITVSDANSNSYVATTSTPITDGNVTDHGGIYYLKNAPANASKTVNITVTGQSGSVNTTGYLIEYAGADPTSPLESDATHVNSATTSTTMNDPSITTTNDGDALIFIARAGAVFSSVNSPWSLVSSIHGANGCGDLLQATHGAQAIAATQSSSVQWAAIEAAFKPSVSSLAAQSWM